uniref:Tumor associated calcium signal transducer 2 n=1 Tax=Sphenodon punctatus TaxID=8508 RepID=A0A8D0HH12_SPHPU
MEPENAVLLLMLVTVSAAQNDCSCLNNKRTHCDFDTSGKCLCRSVGSNHQVDCSTLTSKCLLKKAEMFTVDSKRFPKPSHGYLDNDGIYDPDCEDNGVFKARQCNQTDTCWCVNTAGIRRTEKGDRNLICNELVRTNWIFIEMKHREMNAPFAASEVETILRQIVQDRYYLRSEYIPLIEYQYPYIHIDLKQNATQKSYRDVDIVDVAYYFERDIKHNSIFSSSKAFNLSVNGLPMEVEEILIYYVDEKPPEFSMKRLTAGVSAVAVVIVLAIILGITVLFFIIRRRTGKYEKVEMKGMGEMRRGQNSQLP